MTGFKSIIGPLTNPHSGLIEEDVVERKRALRGGRWWLRLGLNPSNEVMTTPTVEQKVALAKMLPRRINHTSHLPWRCEDRSENYRHSFHWLKEGIKGLERDGEIGHDDWLLVCHEAEATLTKEQCYQYQEALSKIVGDWEPKNGAPNWLWHANAFQRADGLINVTLIK